MGKGKLPIIDSRNDFVSTFESKFCITEISGKNYFDSPLTGQRYLDIIRNDVGAYLEDCISP